MTKKKNITFSIRPSIYREFQLTCAYLGFEYSPTVEKLMKVFTKNRRDVVNKMKLDEMKK